MLKQKWLSLNLPTKDEELILRSAFTLPFLPTRKVMEVCTYIFIAADSTNDEKIKTFANEVRRIMNILGDNINFLLTTQLRYNSVLESCKKQFQKVTTARIAGQLLGKFNSTLCSE